VTPSLPPESDPDHPASHRHSDQLPEEAPGEVVLDDAPEAPEGGAREAARRLARSAAGDQSPGDGRRPARKH